MDTKILENLFQVTIDRGNLWNHQDQIFHQRIMVDLGLLKSGQVELRSTIDRWNLRKIVGIHCKKLTLIVRNFFLLGRTCAVCKVRRADSRENGEICVSASPRTGFFWKFRHGQWRSRIWKKQKIECETDKRMSSIAESCDEHSIIWWMFMATTLNAATFKGRISQLYKVLSRSMKVLLWNRCSMSQRS